MRIQDTAGGNRVPRAPAGWSGAAGLDLGACFVEAVELAAGARTLVPTGLAIHIADPSLEAVMLPLSGLGHTHGLVLGNLSRLTDSDHPRQLTVPIWPPVQDLFTI